MPFEPSPYPLRIHHILLLQPSPPRLKDAVAVIESLNRMGVAVDANLHTQLFRTLAVDIREIKTFGRRIQLEIFLLFLRFLQNRIHVTFDFRTPAKYSRRWMREKIDVGILQRTKNALRHRRTRLLKMRVNRNNDPIEFFQ